MTLKSKRIIFFTQKMKLMATFYGDILGLKQIDDPIDDSEKFLQFDPEAIERQYPAPDLPPHVMALDFSHHAH
jgi:hypothetical protein